MSEWPINWRAVVDEAIRRRKKEGLTQADLAVLAGVSRPTVVAFEQGEINLRFERVIAILDALGLFVQPGRTDSLQSFVYDAQRRFEELTTALAPHHPSRQPRGHSEQAYALDAVETLPTLAALKAILSAAPQTSGWSPFWVPTKESIKPSFQDGLLECWLGKPDADRVFNDAAHSDFWRVARDGTAYLRRGYQEDGRDLDAGSFFDLTLPIWRTAEVLLHAAWLARRLDAPGGGRIRFHGRYTGLAGRELLSWTKPTLRLALDERHVARSDSVEIAAATSADEIEAELEQVVGRIVRPLYERFDGYDPPEALITGQIAEFRRNMEQMDSIAGQPPTAPGKGQAHRRRSIDMSGKKQEEDAAQEHQGGPSEGLDLARELAAGRRVFTACQFDRAEVERRDLTGAVFHQCRFEQANFKGAVLEETEWVGCSLAGSNFDASDCNDARFLKCNLANTAWRGAKLGAARFEDCKLTGADFAELKLMVPSFIRCLLVSAHLRGASFRKRTLEGLDFSDADLGGADFRDAVLVDCRLRDAALRLARFDNADLRGCNLGALSLASVDAFRGAVISRDQASELLQGFGIRVV